MRRFRVYISHGYSGCPDEEAVAEVPDDATDSEIEKECRAVWDDLVNELDSGWHEIDTVEPER